MKNQFRKDIVTLANLFRIFRDCEQFFPVDEEREAYQKYWDFLTSLTEKYHKTAQQIASAINC